MREILDECRQFFIYTGVLSFLLNLLLLTPMIYMIYTMDKVISSRSLETLYSFTALAIYVFFIEGLFESAYHKLTNRLGITLQHILGRPTLKGMLASTAQDVQIRHSMEDVDLLQDFITTKGVKATFDIPWIPVYIIILYYFHPSLAVYAVVSIILLTGLAVWEHKVTHDTQLQVGAYSRAARDFLAVSLQNNEIITTLGMEQSIGRKWWVRNEEYLQRKNRVESGLIRIIALTKLVRQTITTLALGTAVYYSMTSSVSSGIILGAMMLLPRAMQPISSVISTGKSFIDAQAAYQRLNDLFASQKKSSQALHLPAPIGQLSVERVFFYLARDRNILSGINFAVEPGDCLAVMGASASGKSSLAKLLVGYYQPSDGFVRLDGADVSLWIKNGLGVSIGYLPQDVQLFSGTVAENIARLQTGKDVQPKVIAAAQQARVHDLILKLPNGYDSEVGEQGCKLSGGQRQRIGLARALYGQPKFMVLDEPDANLDGQAELELLALLQELKQLRITVVVISHKPNVVAVADKVLVLHEGQQMQFGSRDNVLSQLKTA